MTELSDREVAQLGSELANIGDAVRRCMNILGTNSLQNQPKRETPPPDVQETVSSPPKEDVRSSGKVIGTLKPDSTKVSMIAMVEEVGAIKESKNGKRYQTLTLGDASGEISLTLFDTEQLDQYKKGDYVEIKNGYCGEYQGKLQLNVGKFGFMQKA